uniref:PTB domain-containing protein n=1 Tax=Parascaris equorum TaxID=6256 RepID=A0A914SE25_PAREQ
MDNSIHRKRKWWCRRRCSDINYQRRENAFYPVNFLVLFRPSLPFLIYHDAWEEALSRLGRDFERRRHVNSVVENDSPSYWVEHLATFAVGREFGLQFPSDGVRKLKQLEKNSAIWAQPMVLRLRPNMVSVEDENGDWRISTHEFESKLVFRKKVDNVRKFPKKSSQVESMGILGQWMKSFV